MYQYYCSKCGTRYHTNQQIKYLSECPKCNPFFSEEIKKTIGLRKARSDLKSEYHKRMMNRKRVQRHRKKQKTKKKTNK